MTLKTVRLSVFFVLVANSLLAQTPQSPLKFDFGSKKPEKSYVAVMPNDVYDQNKGYGFLKGAKLKAGGNANASKSADNYLTSDKPFFFSVNLPEGNYNVKIVYGDKAGTSAQTFRAECRRMMVAQANTANGQVRSAMFTVNIHSPEIANTTTSVRLKQREFSYFHWDKQLTLEFNGGQPKICAVEISPAINPVTVFLAGNSTVVDQAAEPYASWGQMIPSFFVPGKVVVANLAESGEALSSFKSSLRLQKILSMMRKGDYLFIEFGHNDQKQRGEGVGAFTSYTRDLLYYISETKKRGGIPVLVTSVNRRSFDGNGKIVATLGDYPEAVRRVAKQEHVALIDLNNMTKTLYEAWGPDESLKAFVHYPANTFPGQEKALADNTHFNPYGAFEIAQCVRMGIKEQVPSLAKYLRSGVADFNPAQPDAVASFYWPLSPAVSIIKPDGN